LSGPDEADAPKRGPMRFRRSNAPRLEAESARRQGEIARIAFTHLGREDAMEFLNSDNAELGARPLDLATASAGGFATVEEALSRLALRPPSET
jgi:hypothetical protein